MQLEIQSQTINDSKSQKLAALKLPVVACSLHAISIPPHTSDSFDINTRSAYPDSKGNELIDSIDGSTPWSALHAP